MSGVADEIELCLRWRRGRGAYADYFAALAQGRALASRDAASGRVSFPPRMDQGAQYLTLPGTGTLVAVTCGRATLPLQGDTAPACFALVAMDGADNLSFARLLETREPPQEGERVRLTPVSGAVPHPAQAAAFVVIADEGADASTRAGP